MKIKIIIFFLVAMGYANEFNMTLWVQGVERLFTTISYPEPLKREFTPEYLAKRTMESAMQGQWARFRSQVALAMINSVDDEVKVCPPPHVCERVVRGMKDELEELGFTVYIITNGCHNSKNGLLVRLPSPSDDINTTE